MTGLEKSSETTPEDKESPQNEYPATNMTLDTIRVWALTGDIHSVENSKRTVVCLSCTKQRNLSCLIGGGRCEHCQSVASDQCAMDEAFDAAWCQLKALQRYRLRCTRCDVEQMLGRVCDDCGSNKLVLSVTEKSVRNTILEVVNSLRQREAIREEFRCLRNLCESREWIQIYDQSLVELKQARVCLSGLLTSEKVELKWLFSIGGGKSTRVWVE